MAISKSISELSVAPSISTEDLVLISRNDRNNLVSL